jgi:putative ABC transport system permease protein
MRGLSFDLRDALRAFRRDRAYTITVILTLALTIGATTAIFSIVNGVLMKPLSYPDPERLVALRENWAGVNLAPTPTGMEVNERHFQYWREHAASFEGLATYRALPANLTGAGDAAQISLVRCSGSLFDVLGADAAIGRTLRPSDEPEGMADVAVIADALWKTRFDADPAIAGRSIVLDGRPYEIVGVLRPDFRLPNELAGGGSDAFIPLRVNVGWVGDHNNQAVGRLRAGVTLEQARAELDLLQAQVAKFARGASIEPLTFTSVVIPLGDFIVGRVRQGLVLLLGTIAGVLLIACANLANLSLTRSLGRARETAVRAALGAGRARLVATVLLEHLWLAIAGGALGLLVASTGLSLFVQTAPIDLPRAGEVALDGRVILFAIGVSLVAALVVAIIPAWRAGTGRVQTTLRASATAVAGDRGALRSHAALLTMQVGLSVTLLVVTALLGVSFLRVLDVDRGFNAEHVLAVDLAMPGTRYANEPARQAAYDRILNAIHTLPGVQAASTTSMLPLRGVAQVNFVAKQGNTLPVTQLPSANFRYIAPEFFETLGIAITRGRAFTDTERRPDRPAPALVSESTAARLWPGEDPLGKRFSRGIPNEQGFEVVGVVVDARMTALDRTPPLMVYLPYWWRSRAATTLLVRTSIEPEAMVASVRRAVHGIDPEIAVGESRPLSTLVEASLAGRRYQVQLLVTFGGVALFIATVGVYAVAAHSISRRRREMNIRVALGSPHAQVRRLIVWQASRPVIVGLLAGTAGALVAGSVLANLLFEVRANDPTIVSVVVTVVALVSMAAAGIATRQGLSIDPSAVLHDE